MNLPLLTADPDAPLLWRQGRPQTAAGFIGDALALAERLPDARHVLNLCDDRGLFMRAFAAVCLRGQTNLLPPNRIAGSLRTLVQRFPGVYALCDTDLEDLGCEMVRVDGDSAEPRARIPQIAAEHVAALAFTSGSTGPSQPYAKSWRTLHASGALCAQRLFGTGVNVVATVPPQHMYGLETSVLAPLTGGCRVDAARPFFPADIRAALAALPAPRALVTTPVHLRSCVDAGLDWPALRGVASATAPLDAALAQRAEAALGAPVREGYGCTEAGMMATRRTVEGPRWTPLPGVRLASTADGAAVTADHLDAPTLAPDQIAVDADGTFTLLGRNADMVKVAGKRASLADLTTRLLAIDGVQDGVFVMPDSADAGARLAALVVAPGLTEAQILAALARDLDPVFLPRPLRKLARLPRNALGKLPRAELLAVLNHA